jgi:aspartyl/asparaginyl beta-hydroxylase (cupin superfamily)
MFISYKLPLAFDASLLKEDLEQVLESDWVRHFNRQYYEGIWKGLALRSTSGRANQLHTPPDETAEALETPVLTRCHYFQQVLAAFNCPIQTARLLSLGPGSRILEHTDDFLGGEDGLTRIHIPITTDERVEYIVGSNRLVMNEGEAWCINFSLPHRITNASDKDRVHLVIDFRINEWFARLLPSIIKPSNLFIEDSIGA